MSNFGHIELHIKHLLECHLIGLCLEKLVIYHELEYQAFWAIKQLNFDFQLVGEKRLLQLNGLEEI